MTFLAWQQKGTYQTILGHEVFVVDEGNAAETLVILHGFPSCSYDFWSILPTLTAHFRVIVHDHLGFGLSDKPKDYTYSLIDQADIALQLWQNLGIERAHLLAHDYGTSIATEIIARQNKGYASIQLLSATLGNGSMLIEMAHLQLIQRLMRMKTVGSFVPKLSTKTVFNYSMKRLWADRSKINQADLDVLWEMLHYKDSFAVFHKVSRYTYEREQFWHRWIGALKQTNLHINLLWADKDPIAIVDMAHYLQQLIPNNHLKILPNIGHYPMLEAPDLYAAGVLEMINKKV